MCTWAMGFFLRLSLETWLGMGVLSPFYLSKFNSASLYMHAALQQQSWYCVKRCFWITASYLVVLVDLMKPFHYPLGSNYRWFSYSETLFIMLQIAKWWPSLHPVLCRKEFCKASFCILPVRRLNLHQSCCAKWLRDPGGYTEVCAFLAAVTDGRVEDLLWAVPQSVWGAVEACRTGWREVRKTPMREERGGPREYVTEVGETFLPCDCQNMEDSEFFLKSFKIHLWIVQLCALIFLRRPEQLALLLKSRLD